MKMKIQARAGRCVRLSRQIGAASLVLGMAMSTVAIARDARVPEARLRASAEHVAVPMVGVDRVGTPAVEGSFSTKVFGGTTAGPRDNPFTVALVDAAEPNDRLAQICEGILYKPTVVLTSAYCVDELSPKQLRVLTGTRALNGTGTRREIDRFVLHPKFNRDAGADYDIAIVRLKSPVLGIPLPTLAAADPPVGTLLLSTGWGGTAPADNVEDLPIFLTKAYIPLVSRSNCNDANSYTGAITARMLCAGYDTQPIGPCGEIGSPLALGNTLVGISSLQGFCPSRNRVPVFTRISNPEIRNFILNND